MFSITLLFGYVSIPGIISHYLSYMLYLVLTAHLANEWCSAQMAEFVLAEVENFQLAVKVEAAFEFLHLVPRHFEGGDPRVEKVGDYLQSPGRAVGLEVLTVALFRTQSGDQWN